LCYGRAERVLLSFILRKRTSELLRHGREKAHNV
jgi:hypothetical protein